MAEPKVLVVHSHGVGQFASVTRLPHHGETLRAWNWRIAEDGGKGSNVSIALGRLGVPTAFIGKVGDDAWGDLGRMWMEAAGVDCSQLIVDPSVQTGTALILVDEEANNTIIDGDGSGHALTVEETTSAIDKFPGAKYAISGFEIPEKVALESLRHAASLGMFTALNPSPAPEEDMGRLEWLDLMQVNEHEAADLCDPWVAQKVASSSEPDRAFAIGRAVLEKYGCRIVLVTLGREGSVWVSEDESFHVPSVEVPQVLGTAGAGDGFLAALICALSEGKTNREAVEFATGYAALAVTFEGSIPSYRQREEVEAFLSSL